MFNVSQKEDFINHLLEKTKISNKEKYQNQLINFFNRLAPIEQELGKDLSMCNYEETKIVLSILCRRSVKYQKSILSQLRQYLDWCIDTGKSLDSENRLVGITPSDIDYSISYKMSMVKDEEQLSEYLDIVLQSIHEDTIHNMYRGLFHLVFNGITLKEAIDLKKSDVDPKNKKAYVNGRCIELSDVCCDVIEYLSSMNGYVVNNKFKGNFIEIFNSGHVLERTSDNRDVMEEALRPKVSEIMSELKQSLRSSITITLNTLFLSGVFYRMYKKECNKGEIDFSEYMMQCENQSVTINNPEGVVDDGLQEYASWKKAFNLT